MGGHHSAPKLLKIGSGGSFYNIRGRFKIAGILDIGTHMSICKLANDKFLIIDTIELEDGVKQEIDQLTNNGKDIEAVVATHPFHTLAFPGFYKAYPNVPYYGTPRHLRNLTDIPWAGEISQHLNDWAPDIVMSIPAGAEYVNPQPESSNHFISVWVFCPAAKTIHVDDTLLSYTGIPSPVLFVAGKKKDGLDFHPSIHAGLLPDPEAPGQFIDWTRQILKDWDFENICCAHTGVKYATGHADLVNLLNAWEPDLRNHALKQHKAEAAEDCSKYNVKGHECG